MTQNELKTNDNLFFTLDYFHTKETDTDKPFLTCSEVVNLFKTKTPQRQTAFEICVKMNYFLTLNGSTFTEAKKKPITAFNLPIDVMQYLNEKRQLSPNFKARKLYET